MKRSWMGAGLLLVLLFIGIFSARAMIRFHDPIARDLSAAAEVILTGDWEQALTLSQQAQLQWEKQELLRSCFADHDPVEEIDSCFSQLVLYGKRKEETAFAAACAETAKKVEAVAQAHKLNLHIFF